MDASVEITALLKAFLDGYVDRDVSKLDAFMELFDPMAEVIGTNGSRPKEGEWYLDRDGARELVKGDWEDWGDLRFDPDNANIRVIGSAAQISLSATVTKRIGEENYQSYLEYVKDYIDLPDIPAKQKLYNILRGGTNTVFELNRGEKFVWPIRITAVAVKDDRGRWRFTQMCFSFSTIYFPDTRIIEPASP
jgi:hypothetical protein